MSGESELRTTVEEFIAAAAEPALLDRGEDPLRLVAGQWELGEWGGRLTLHAWAGERNLTRRMSKLAFRDRFALALAREFPQWTLEEASAEPNLEASLSPAYVRAYLRRGSNGIAVMAAPPDALDCAGILPFGLIWLEHLRRREKRVGIEKLFLYAPAKRERAVAYRAAIIDQSRVECRMHAYHERLRMEEIDPADVGNVDSSLPACGTGAGVARGMAPELGVGGVDRVPQSDGTIRYEVRGLEFARWSGERLTCGIARKRRASVAEAAAMARELARVRNGEAEDRQHPLYTQNPERWLEALVRSDASAIDASLGGGPIYGQAPMFAGRDRGVVDLLTVDHAGRLVVIELKTSADVQLPFQAVDYWLRVRKHLAAGDFERLGYFPGIAIRRENPRVLLVAPALEFHSTSETLISFIKPEIEITRIGVAANWRRELKVMTRLRGAETP